MADEVNAKNESKFRAHPAGQFAAICVDTLNMGAKVEQFGDNPEKLVPKCMIVFRTGEKNPETGDVIDISREFTISMGEKANLRQFLEGWRGKSYSDDEADAGVPLHKLVGHKALITVEHRKSGKGRTYANIKGITPLPKQMAGAAPLVDGYKRPEYFEDRKKEYAQEVEKFMESVRPSRSEMNVGGREDFKEFDPQPDEADDDLPF